MTYRLKGFINGFLLLPSALCVQNPKFDTWIQYDYKVKSWIFGLVSFGMNDVPYGLFYM